MTLGRGHNNLGRSILDDALGLMVSDKKISFQCFPYINLCYQCDPGATHFWPQGPNLKRSNRWCYIPNIKALGLMVSDKKIFPYISQC